MAILCLHLNPVFAQNNSTITGTVRNAAGQLLAGASVTNTRTGRGTVTNAAGAFTLHGTQAGDQLRISYIGYAVQTLALGKGASLTITLKEATNELDRVVVQAYGTTTDRLRTGNIGKLTAADIEKQPVMNVLDALQGQIPGVVVSRNNGSASGSMKIEIRGRSTINFRQTSEPLYVVDGVPLTILNLTGNDSYPGGSEGVIQSGIPSPAQGQSPFFNINPADIESLEVLKDADATAIYGSRAANGVILITTKKGRMGKSKVEASFYTGYSEVPNSSYAKLLNTAQYVAMRKEALKNDGLPVNAGTAPDLVAWDTTRYTDWQRLMWNHTGRTTDANLVFSGGDVRTNFRLGANFQQQSEIQAINGSNLRGGLSMSLKHQSVNRRFSLALSSLYTTGYVDIITNPGAFIAPPNAPAIYDSQGNLNYTGWQPLNYRYPFQYILQPYSSETYLLNSSLMLNYEIIDGLNFRTTLGYNTMRSLQSEKKPIKSQDPQDVPTASHRLGNSFAKNILLEPQLDWTRFVWNGRLTVLVGGSLQRNKTEGSTVEGTLIPNDALIENIGSAPQQAAGYSRAWYKYIAAFGRVNYNWNNRYLLNLNARRDGSSKFGPGRQFGNFASVGGAYIFTETALFKKYLPIMSFGKIRASYGTTGGDQIGNYAFLTAWAFTSKRYNGSQVLYPTRHTDSTLQWQVNKKLELAAAFTFFKDRLSLDVSWYRHRCNNQLVDLPTPLSTGFQSVLTNMPANVQNTGWEFILSGQPVNARHFKYYTRINMGINRNKLLSYPDLEQSPYASTLVVGQPLNLIKLLHYNGVDPQTGKYTFEDRNKDGSVTIIENPMKAEDDRYFTTLNVKFDGGFSHSFSYKGVSLDIFFYFRKQLGLKSAFSGIAGGYGNQPIDVLDRWQQKGDHATIASFTTTRRQSDIYFSNYSDGIYTDASYVRLKNLALSYAPAFRWIKSLRITDCRISLRFQNLWVISPYRGADPELQSISRLPVPRVITAGLSLAF